MFNEIDKKIESKRYAEAINSINDFLQSINLSLEDKKKLLIKLCNCFYFEGDYLSAIKQGEHYLRLGGDFNWVYARIGMANFKLGNYSEAAKSLKIAIDLGLNNKYVNVVYAKSLMQVNQNDAISFLRECVDKDVSIIFEDWGMKRVPLKNLLQKRIETWFHSKESHKYSLITSLLEKTAMNKFMRQHGVKVPTVYADKLRAVDFSFDDYPSNLVVKPIDGANSFGVFVIKNRVDLFQRKRLENNFLSEFVLSNKKKIEDDDVLFMVEELIEDVGLENDPYLMIPRDFKIFAVNGKVIWINVYNRNSEKRFRTVVSYDADFRPLPKTTESYLEGSYEEKPEHFDELLNLAKKISKSFPYLMRLDFFISKSGPVFGEFTPNPGGGLSYLSKSERALVQLLSIYPDDDFSSNISFM